MATIGKRTMKLSDEKKAKQLYDELSEEKKADLHTLIGRIVCGQYRNFYSTRLYKNITNSLDKNHRAIVTYICMKVSKAYVFEDVQDLKLFKE